MIMTKNKIDKIVDLNQYKHDRDFDEDFFEDLLNLSEEELDDLYDDIAFGPGLFDDEKAGQDLLADLENLEELEDEIYPKWQALPEKGWVNLEARPYLSIRMDLATLYKQNGLYEKALEIFSSIYREDANDGLGCRYEIMSLYALKSDYFRAEAFFESRPEHQDDVLMLVPLLVAAILYRSNSRADELIRILDRQVPAFREFCLLPNFPFAQVLEAANLDYYQDNSIENLYLAFYPLLPLLSTATVFVQAYLNRYFSENESSKKYYMFEDSSVDLLDLITPGQLVPLRENGIQSIEDLANYTEKELLAIPRIGKTTLKKIKEAGVKLKK